MCGVDEIMIGEYSGGGGVSIELGEFAIRWHDHGDGKPVPRLEMFGDSWACLASEDGALIIQWLVGQHRKGPSPAEVCAFLSSIGMKDRSDKS